MTFRRHALRAFALVPPASALLSLAACAGTVPPAAPPPAATTAAPPPAPPPDVTAVPTPDNLVVFARVKNLSLSSKVATDWAHLPTLDAATFVEGFIDGATDTKGNATLASVVDPALPIDFAASFEAKLPPKAFGAFSAAVKSIEAAKSTLASKYDLTPGDGGVILLVRHEGDAGATKKMSEEGASLPTCELAPAAGAAPFRLVCGVDHDSLTALAPYLARTAPREVTLADVHVEFRAKPVGGYATIGRLQGPKMIGSLLGLNAATEPATVDLVTAVIGDLLDYVSDLDVMTFDATLDPAHAGLAMRTTFKSKASLIAQLSTAHPERVDVPPSPVWRLPADVDFVSFGAGIDDADLQHPRDLTVAALAEQLAKTKLADADRRALTDVVKESFHAPRMLVAHGMEGAASYWLLERDEAPAVSEKLVRDWIAGYNRPGIAQWLKSKLPSGGTPPVFKVGAPLAGLPKGSLHYEVTVFPESAWHAPMIPRGHHAIPAKGATPPAALDAPETVHLVVVPDGPRSWIGLSGSDSALKSRLASVVSAVPAADSLGVRAGLQGLSGFKEARMSAGGFLTVRSLLELARLSMTGKHASKLARLDALAARLPAKGVTPILITAAPGAPTADDPGGVRDAEVNVPADAIRDAVWFALQADDILGK